MVAIKLFFGVFIATKLLHLKMLRVRSELVLVLHFPGLVLHFWFCPLLHAFPAVPSRSRPVPAFPSRSCCSCCRDRPVPPFPSRSRPVPVPPFPLNLRAKSMDLARWSLSRLGGGCLLHLSLCPVTCRKLSYGSVYLDPAPFYQALRLLRSPGVQV